MEINGDHLDPPSIVLHISIMTSLNLLSMMNDEANPVSAIFNNYRCMLFIGC